MEKDDLITFDTAAKPHIDYFEAAYSLENETGLSRDLMFQKIYTACKSQVPNVLYKYYSLDHDNALNELKLNTLKDRKIFLSNPKDFNDPFDGKGFFYEPQRFKRFFKPYYNGRNLIDDYIRYQRVTSLTSNGVQSMPMWAHYANNHRGFCVSYNMEENPVLHNNMFPVQYKDKRLDITSFLENQAERISKTLSENCKRAVMLNDLSSLYLISLLSNIKHISWSYEMEYRCTVIVAEDKPTYVRAIPQAIFLGMRISDENAKKLTEIAKQIGVDVYRMSFDESSASYKLIYGKQTEKK